MLDSAPPFLLEALGTGKDLYARFEQFDKFLALVADLAGRCAPIGSD